MYICYLDESGHCGKKANEKQPIETIVGVMTDLSKLNKTQHEHKLLLKNLQYRGIEADELKGSDMYQGRKEWSQVAPQIRCEVFEDLLKWANDRKCKFIVCPIDSLLFFEKKKNGCTWCEKFNYPFEAAAMNAILAVQRENKIKKNNKGRTILIFDEQQKHDNGLLKLLSEDLSYTDTYTSYEEKKSASHPPRLNQIVDVPHFSKSHMSVLIQIADIAAFVVNRYIDLWIILSQEKYSGEKERILGWYQILSKGLVKPTSIDPPGNGVCEFYRNIRPSGWSAQNMAKAQCIETSSR